LRNFILFLTLKLELGALSLLQAALDPLEF
jgi:hypothetical protein